MSKDRLPATERVARHGPWPTFVWTLPVLAILVSTMDVGDLAYLVRAGEVMIDTGSLLRRDVFTFTMLGEPWLNQQWGAEIVFAALHRTIGWQGLVVVRAILVGGLVGATYDRARRTGVDPTVAAGVTLAGFVVAVGVPGTLSLRPQLLAAALFVAAGVLLDRRGAHPRGVLLLLPIGVVWANTHGSFPLLFLLVALTWIRDAPARSPALRWTVPVGVASLALPFLTPWGFGTYAYLIDISTTPVIQDLIDEWRPLWHHPFALVAMSVYAACLVALVSRRGRLPRSDEIIGLAIFTALALWSARNVVWWFLYVTPVAASLLTGWRLRSQVSRLVTLGISACLAALIVLGLVRVVGTDPSTDLLHGAPTAVASVVDEMSDPGDRVFAGRWGGWLELEVPDALQFVDPRAEFFEPAIWEEFLVVATAEEGWDRILDRWRVDVVVASTERHGSLIEALDGSVAWQRVHLDDEGAVFIRS